MQPFRMDDYLDEGIVLQRLDDLCLVHVEAPHYGPKQHIGEKLLAYMEHSGCRKLVMSFAGVESISRFLLDHPPHLKSFSGRLARPAMTPPSVPAGSDLWLG